MNKNRSTNSWGRGLSILMLLLVIASGTVWAEDARSEEERRWKIVASMLTLRALDLDTPRPLIGLVALIDENVSSATPLQELMTAWANFLQHAVVQPGRLDSTAPVALYYNPYSDVALIVEWQHEDSIGWVPVRASAVPGGILLGLDPSGFGLRLAAVSAADPVAELRNTAKECAAAFEGLHPKLATIAADELFVSERSAKALGIFAEIRVLRLAAQNRALANEWLVVVAMLMQQASNVGDLPEGLLERVQPALVFDSVSNETVLVLAETNQDRRQLSIQFSWDENDGPQLLSADVSGATGGVR